MEYLSKFSSYREKLEKDLAEKHILYSQLIEELIGEYWGNVDEIDESIPHYEEIKHIYSFCKRVLPLVLLINYDSLIHSILYDKDFWEQEVESEVMDGMDFHCSANDVFNFLLQINIDAAITTVERLKCPQKDIQALKDSLANSDRELFVSTFEQITCDISFIYRLANLYALVYVIIVGLFTEPQTAYDLIFCSNFGSFTKIIRESAPSTFKQSLFVRACPRKDENEDANRIKRGLIEFDYGMLQVARGILMLSSIQKEKFDLFPFEEDYYNELLTAPELQPYLERAIKELEEQQDYQGQPVDSTNLETKEQEETQQASSKSKTFDEYANDVVLDLDLPEDFFNEENIDRSIKTIGTIDSDFKKAKPFADMINILAEEKYIEPELGNRRKLASVLSGRKVVGLENYTEPVKWIEKKARKHNQTEKMMLWICRKLYTGYNSNYEKAYELLNMECTLPLKPGNITSYAAAPPNLEKKILEAFGK